MLVGRGIPLPENIESSGLTCVQLYIPTDDEGMYIQALAGAYSQMGKWNYWQKDGTDRGARTAVIWRDAIDLTYEEAWLSGVFMTCTQVEDLVNAINGIRVEMVVSNNNLINAIRALELTTAPIDCLPCGERVEVPPNPDPDPDPDIPPVGTDREEWEAYLCRATNYLWYEHVMRGGSEFVLLATTGGGLLSVGSVLAILYATGIGAPIAFVGTIITAIVAIAISYDQTSLEVELERLSDPMICAITTATGTVSALQAMRDTLVAESATQEVIDYIMSITGSNAMNKLFAGEIVVPDEFIEINDCTCGGPVPGNWSFSPENSVLGEHDVVLNVVSDAEFSFVGTIVPVGTSGRYAAKYYGLPADMTGYDAVSFDFVPNYSPVVSGKRYRPVYGEGGTAFDLINTSAALGVTYRTLVMVAGFSHDPNDYDLIFTVVRSRLVPTIAYATTAAGAIEVDVDMHVTNFTLYPTP